MYLTSDSSLQTCCVCSDPSPVKTADQGMSSAEGQTGEPGDRRKQSQDRTRKQGG